MAEFSGGIVFTDKEWRTARNKGDKYYVGIVSNL